MGRGDALCSCQQITNTARTNTSVFGVKSVNLRNPRIPVLSFGCIQRRNIFAFEFSSGRHMQELKPLVGKTWRCCHEMHVDGSGKVATECLPSYGKNYRFRASSIEKAECHPESGHLRLRFALFFRNRPAALVKYLFALKPFRF